MRAAVNKSNSYWQKTAFLKHINTKSAYEAKTQQHLVSSVKPEMQTGNVLSRHGPWSNVEYRLK